MGYNRVDVCRYRGELVTAVSAATAMVLVYHLSYITKLELALNYRAPTLLSAYASHFVHLRPGHLLTNLGAFGLLFVLGYRLAGAGDRRWLFRAAAVTYLVAFPLALSALNLALPRSRIGFGFSGIAMAFLGLLPLAMGTVLEARFPRTRAVARTPGLFMVGLAVIAWLAVPPVGLRPILVVAIAFAALVHLPWVPTVDDVGAGIRWLVDTRRGGLVLAGFAALVLVPFAAFPSTPASGNEVTNLYSHFLGYCLGFLVPYTAVHVVAWLDGFGAGRAPVARDGGAGHTGSRLPRRARIDGD